MGTYYNIRYVSDKERVTKNSLDSLLENLNMEVSTYIPQSTISRINSGKKEQEVIVLKKSPHFVANYLLSREMYSKTDSFFDPTLNPLVNFWGFGYEERASAQKDTSKIAEMLEWVSMGKWSEEMVNDSILIINKPKKASLDLSAIAKGYGVDIIADFLETHGLQNYFIDIGGEVRAKGEKPNDQFWIVGINKPDESAGIREAELYLKIEDYAVATSGNYRNFYEEDGKKYSHTINPFTGLTEKSNLLSTTIIHETCAKADAMATACMVRGVEGARKMISSDKDFEGLLIFTNPDGEMTIWTSRGFEKYLLE